ncbi:L-iditol 2-dehydrogenase [Thalassobius sp. MITS945101]|uniref:L-iditol 2-dehydrogenase n=1 Tax=Thalassobius sp. MITS945101 TaxID=3096994 RepID=UPI00399AE7A9
MKRLEGKSALITGGARGIGRAFASAYVQEGAQVVVADINLSQAQQSAEEIGATAIAMDVWDLDSIRHAVAEAEAQLGQIDILINNAAVFSAAPLVEITPEDFAKVFDVNVKGTLFTLQAVAQQMIRRGIPGKIINMASQAGRRGEPLVAVYCASKAAVISLTQSAGLDLIQHGINVNAISPGVVDGAHWDEVDRYFAQLEDKAVGQKKAEVGAAVPYGRMGRAADLTGMAVFLASEEADYIVAQTYNVDGGQWMS